MKRFIDKTFAILVIGAWTTLAIWLLGMLARLLAHVFLAGWHFQFLL